MAKVSKEDMEKFEKEDKKMDKKMGVKEGSKKDEEMDVKMAKRKGLDGIDRKFVKSMHSAMKGKKY